jgi:hypothetical protein
LLALRYNAWFKDEDTLVRPVEDCRTVMCCVDAMRDSGIAQSLEVSGIVDRDYRSDNFFGAMPAGIHPLPVPEVESLLPMPTLVEAVARHMGRESDPNRYLAELCATVNVGQYHASFFRRWKARIESHLAGLVASTGERNASLDELMAEMPALSDMNHGFSPQQFLEEDKTRVASGLSASPGQSRAPAAWNA